MLYPPELESSRPRDHFDPVREGERHGLSPELSLALWKRVSEDGTGILGRCNEAQAREQFRKFAARITACGGRLLPDPGRLTRVGTEIDEEWPGTWADKLLPRVPGRQTLVAGEARRWATRAGDASAAMAERQPPSLRGLEQYGVLALKEVLLRIIDVITQVLNVIAGIIGIISAVMWLITIITVGVASPLAATLSSIALAIGAATMVVDGINNLVLQPCVLLFRALHTFNSQADPTQVEAEGEGIGDAAQRAAGFLGGLVGAKAGEHVAEGGANRIQARINARAQAAAASGGTAAPEGQAAPKEGQAAPPEGQAAPQEGQAAPQEGQAAPHEGQPAPHEGQPAPHEGQPALHEGQAAPQEGQPAPQEGQPAPHEGQAAPQEGQAAPQEAQAAPKQQGKRVTDSPLSSKTGETYEVERWTEMKDGESRTYRLIEVRGPDGKVISSREEIFNVKDRWQQRGSEGNARGEVGEAASRRMTQAELAKTPEGTKALSVDVQNASGHGFDEVVLRIRPDGTAEVHILEVKDLGGQVAGSDMTAVRENIETNLNALAAKVSVDYEAMGLTLQERNAVLQAIQQRRIEITPRIGPETKLATKADASRSRRRRSPSSSRCSAGPPRTGRRGSPGARRGGDPAVSGTRAQGVHRAGDLGVGPSSDAAEDHPGHP